MSTNRVNRSNSIVSHAVPGGRLYQWAYVRPTHNEWGRAHLSGFASLRTFDGRPGIYRDAPYYCYGGTHRYRRLPRLVAARVRIAAARGYVADTARRAVIALLRAARPLIAALQHWSPTAILARRAAARQWADFERSMRGDGS